MAYSDSSLNSGRLFPQASRTAGETPTLRPGEIASNAADGCLYVGTTGGAAGVVPGAVGFNQIVSLSQTSYDGLVAATATISTVLYIVTPDPEPEPE
jgi:hypothetical protein